MEKVSISISAFIFLQANEAKYEVLSFIRIMPRSKIGARPKESFDKQLFFARRAKSALTANGLGKLVCLEKGSSYKGGNDELRDTLTAINDLCLIGMIMERYHKLTSIVGVNNTDLVCRGKSSF